jgi:hypothetical protein
MLKSTENAEKPEHLNPLNAPGFLKNAITLLREIRKRPVHRMVNPVAGLTRKELRRFAPDKYSPCVCGSGAKFKWCCWKGEYQSI